MASILAPGVGSGLDVNSIIDQLMNLERLPLDRLQNQESQVNAQISAYGQLRSAVSDFETAMDGLGSLSKFQVFSGSSSNADAFTASADETANVGSFNINVTQLAQRHKLASTTFTNKDTVVGSGTLDISVGSGSFSLTIDSSNNTLAGIRDAINQASDNPGVAATILNESGGSRLILTSNDSGASNAVEVVVSGDAGLSQLHYEAAGTQNLTQVAAAQDAQLTVDTFSVTSSSNTISDAIQGVTLNLKTTGSGTVDFSRDDDAIAESVDAFATAFNNLRNTIDSLYDGQLAGDSTLLTMESLMLGIVNSGASITGGSYTHMTEVGLSIGKDGRMSLDKSALSKAMDSDFSGVSRLFADSDQGFAKRLGDLAHDLLTADGMVDAREDGLAARIDTLQDRQNQLEYRLDLTERRYRAQFAALDSLMGQLQTTSSFLSQQFSS
ncbi:flagellar filament capping protein FliD [Candidatus Endoriftia persephone]|jgi:flagellar hook-associated protein 2|uniref:Flagellar hook-associated protein 2 n=4 Tax=Gammaproteobacteria TaxID=1236 RepID=G2FB79_9GAMM|nr:flagellar filament capping protein FliD [Candidatus Endoriftia persephone]EGV49850.1 flagellar hook-associated protein 2 [endosymbiont of Riftia pachyptila (vent Ph05)]EGW56017.1 flagellar hook-associated protein 2 [endosymbiont of Tevnia jerichonana (vent Tica)]USF88140.1 flagellar filament capping protein FliD [Candidatus Endoriftia persephone]